MGQHLTTLDKLGPCVSEDKVLDTLFSAIKGSSTERLRNST